MTSVPATAERFAALFHDDEGQPRYACCAVLFLDLLSISEATERGQDELRRFHRAVTATFGRLTAPEAPWPAATFSDAVVLAVPLEALGHDESAEAAIGELMIQAGYLQLDLLDEGFVARGGITVGDLYLHRGLVFGPALVDAYRLETVVAVHPRIVLDACVEPLLMRARSSYGDPDRDAPQDTQVMRDADDLLFVDYLSLLFDEVEGFATGLQRHRDVIDRGLTENARKTRVWEKYHWMADYHNAVCMRAGFPPSDVGREMLVDAAKTSRRFGSLTPGASPPTTVE